MSRDVQAFANDLSALEGVQAAIVSLASVSFVGEHSQLGQAVAEDLGKTVRRMTIASTTVGAPLHDLVVNFGASRMFVRPVSDSVSVIVLMLGDHLVDDIRARVDARVTDLAQAVELSGLSPLPSDPRSESEREIDRVREGPLGALLNAVEQKFTVHVSRLGHSSKAASDLIAEQLRQWLMCCNPSPYTLPLLVDSLAQLLAEDTQIRSEFLADVRRSMTSVGMAV